MLRNLELAEIGALGSGTVAEAFNRHLQRAIADCEDRPGDDKARKVTLTLLVKPLQLQDGACTEVIVEAEASSSVPKHVSRPVECRIKHGGRALFNDLSEDNVDQMTIDQA